MTTWGQLAFQDAASPIIIQLAAFHDHAILVVSLVVAFVSYMLANILLSKFSTRKLLEANELEIVWTTLPAVLLIALALPSLRLLYLIDEVPEPQLSVKTIGHQWYWRYEYPDHNNTRFDSYILPTQELKPGEFRLLEVDHRAVIPIKTDIHILVTSSDVIHSWAVPRLGVKVDAIPGRQNQVSFSALRPGAYYGQCSEICGTDHSFIPIVLEAINTNDFLKWFQK